MSTPQGQVAKALVSVIAGATACGFAYTLDSPEAVSVTTSSNATLVALLAKTQKWSFDEQASSSLTSSSEPPTSKDDPGALAARASASNDPAGQQRSSALSQAIKRARDDTPIGSRSANPWPPADRAVPGPDAPGDSGEQDSSGSLLGEPTT